MGFLKRHRTALASGVVLVVGAATLVVFALSANGYAVRHVDLNDGGIWVTSDTDGLFGRLNRPAGALDAAFYPPGGAQSAYQLDVFQDDAAVVAWDRGAGKLFPVDVDRAVAAGDQAVPMSAGDRVGLAGGTLAVLDPSSGKVRATRLDPESPAAAITGIGPGATPVADLGPGSASADVAVGLDGSVYAVSSGGRVAIVRPDGAGFDAPTYGRLTAAVRSVVTTVVGDRLVVLDPSTGTVVLPDGAGASIGVSAGAVLQQPGPDADAVLVATTKSLLSVSLSDGRATVLSSAGTGAPAAPVRLGDCVHAAWAGSPGAYVRSCDGGPARPGNLRDLGALVHPEFRVNRDAIVLNDLASGALWDVENRLKVDDWNAVRPPPVRKQNDKSNNENAAQNVRDQPPKAVDDTLGARPGRTTVLHVLDNDSDPSGNILAVASVTAPDNPAATLAIAPDGQSVEIAMPAGSGDVHFKYTVDDGKGLNATASVTVTARGRNDEQTPQPRVGFQPKAWTVPAGGTLSLPVLPDWRDFDGDPVVLASATATVGSVTTTPDGFLDYTAPPNGGQQTVHYTVSDGIGAPVPATVQVIVQPPTAATPVAAVAQPDVAKGEVGQPIEIHPLANDLPGADPTDPNARLALPGAVPAVSGLDVTTDTRTGTVTVTAPTAGTYVLTYSAAFGNAPFARGTIRVDVVAAPTSPQVPVAMPDTAVLHGAAPVTVDVLANDYDPAGLVLAVQHAAPVDAGSQLRVAVVKGHWLRIDAQTPALQPNPEIVRYTVTDGVTSPVTGEVTVTQLPAPANDTPVPQDDYATVRAGDLVSVPVLDNDTDPGGDPITLVRDVPGAPGSGRLTVTSASGATGTAYVSGSGVTFVAPSTVVGQQTVTVAYVAQDPAGDQAVGHLHVTIDPAASAADPDQPPAPQPIETRAVAGDTVTLSVPTTGVDPDGDSVCVVGVGSAPTLGRITAIGAGSLTYQAYPSSAGTDAFTYLVTDRYGRTGQATIRVAVVPPGDPQPPVAVDDIVTAAPGAHVAVDPLANDLIAPDDTVTVAPLDTTNPGIGTAATLASAGGPVRLTAPGLTGKPFVVRYAETDGLGDPSSADIVVHAQAGYNIPPIAVDTTAHPAPGAHSVDVDVLSGDADPDGDSAALTISHVYAAGAHVNGAKVTLPVLAYPQNVPYEIRDGGGATAVAVIHVPAVGAGAPYLKPGQSITVARNGTTTVSLPTLVADPAGHPLRFTTTDQVWASPSTGLTAREQGETQLVVTARADYAGPAAVAFQVTDGTSLTDPHAYTAVITVPVQVGPPTPVLRCPTDPITVIEGGAPVKVDVSSVCHVWVPDPATLATQRYSASWQGSSGGLTLGGAGTHVLSVTAAGSTTPGAVGRLTVGVAGADVTPAQLRFRVTAAAPPSMAPVTVDGVKAGDTASVDVTSYVRSQLRDPAVSVVSATQTGGMPASVSHAGATVRISPNPQAHGTLTFAVVVTDVSDPTRTDRRATGQITMHVLGVPDAPGTPAPGLTVLNRVVSLSWSAPANNGAPIDSYEVDYGGGHQTCAASPCDITGLANGTSYTFTVKAHNLVGWSPPSGGSAPAVPNTVPGAVTGMTTSDPQDGSLHVSWNAPQDDGTPVLHYEVTWTGGGAATVTGTSTTATGLTNDDTYTFTVIAVNAQGLGPSATVVGQSAGAPATPSAPTLAAADSADSSSKAVIVSWSADDPNGPGPTTYTVDRTGGGSGKTVCSAVTATSCDDDGLANDGTVYTYTVTAANSAPGSAHTSPPSSGTAVEASATPDPITGVSAAPTGNDGQATVSFDAPASHGATSTVSCTANGTGCGSWTFSPNGQRGVTETITGLANGTGETITLTDCNGSKGGAYAGNPCDSGVSTSVTTYGPIKSLTINPSVSGTNVNYAVGVDPNGRPATVHVQTSHGFSQDFTTGTGQWNWSGGDNVGYSTTDTITVTVSDPGRATVSGSNAATTGPPPPPPPTVTVSRGASCGATCINAGCTSSCQYIHVQTANFGGNVTCTFNSQHGPGGFVTQTYAANQSKDSFNWYGYPGEWVQVTCGGVSSPQTPW